MNEPKKRSTKQGFLFADEDKILVALNEEKKCLEAEVKKKRRAIINTEAAIDALEYRIERIDDALDTVKKAATLAAK